MDRKIHFFWVLYELNYSFIYFLLIVKLCFTTHKIETRLLPSVVWLVITQIKSRPAARRLQIYMKLFEHD